MYQLFTEIDESNTGLIRPPGFDLIKRTLELEVYTITSYYHDRVYAINNDHILSRIINTAFVPFDYTLDRYIEAASARAPYIAKLYNLTSTIHGGNIFDGIFYGKGNNEIILYSEEYFNPQDALQNWKQLQPVKVLEHPVSNSRLLVPDGKDHNSEKGLCVIAVDIVLLLIQFRGFMMEQLAKKSSEDKGLLEINHFVRMYVIPNMLYSHVDIMLFNRMYNLYYGAPMGSAMDKYPFSLIDYSSRIDKVMVEILRRVRNKSIKYSTILKMVPTIYSENSHEALQMPDYPRTRQIWWALFLTRFREIKFLLDVGGVKGINSNRHLINQLGIDIKRLLSENVMKMYLTEDQYYDIDSELYRILNI